MDVSGERSGIVITRGASNSRLVAGLIPADSTVYLWTQNDAAGEKWQRDICANTQAIVKRVTIPAPHKDLNQWTRAGATVEDLVTVLSGAQPIEHANKIPDVGHRIPFATDRVFQIRLIRTFCPLSCKRIIPHLMMLRFMDSTVRCSDDRAAYPRPTRSLPFSIPCCFWQYSWQHRLMVADELRHYLNLFGVLVGESSKGRKGTSWHQIVYVLQHVDEEWRNNIANGLSSGEGLIWAVRDPITETKPIKEKGHHAGRM